MTRLLCYHTVPLLGLLVNTLHILSRTESGRSWTPANLVGVVQVQVYVVGGFKLK